MPKNIRNVWFEAVIPGYANVIKGGPKSKLDGMQITIYQRKDNNIIPAFTITTRVFDNPYDEDDPIRIETIVHNCQDNQVLSVRTKR